jgi:hypothetical protein
MERLGRAIPRLRDREAAVREMGIDRNTIVISRIVNLGRFAAAGKEYSAVISNNLEPAEES